MNEAVLTSRHARLFLMEGFIVSISEMKAPVVLYPTNSTIPPKRKVKEDLTPLSTYSTLLLHCTTTKCGRSSPPDLTLR